MNKVFMTLLASVMLVGIMVFPTTTFAEPGSKIINKRLYRQKGRIFHGINNGSLTRREARWLGAEQAKIRVDKFYAKHNDGHIGPREFIYLNHELNHSSRHIYRLKHNDRIRW